MRNFSTFIRFALTGTMPFALLLAATAHTATAADLGTYYEDLPAPPAIAVTPAVGDTVTVRNIGACIAVYFPSPTVSAPLFSSGDSICFGASLTLTFDQTSAVAGAISGDNDLFFTWTSVAAPDTTPPLAPGAPDLDPASDSGISNSDDITKVTTPTLSGTGETGATVTLISSLDATIGTATVTGGVWSITTSALSDGVHDITATQTDVAGNTSQSSAALEVTIDITPPPVPGTPDLHPFSDNGWSNFDDYTNTLNPTFVGTGEVGALVTLFIDGGDTGVSTVVPVSGDWTLTAPWLNNGLNFTLSITVQQSDLAGNITESDALSVLFNTVPPGPVGNVHLVDSRGAQLLPPFTSNDVSAWIEGSHLGFYLEASDENYVTLTVQDLGTGLWEARPFNPFNEGEHTIRLTNISASGMTSDPVFFTFTIDTTPPAAPGVPDLATASDSGSSGTDNDTNITTPILTGTGETGATVTLISSLDATIGTATVTGGAWSITTSALSDGVHDITATQTNVAGSTSVASAALEVTIDTTLPAAPGALDLNTASDSGYDSGYIFHQPARNMDNLTNITTPTFDGTGEAGSVVSLVSSLDGTVGSGTVAAGGGWSIGASLLGEGVHSITVTQTDVAGNTSQSSASLSITIDTTPPISVSGGGLMSSLGVRIDPPWITNDPFSRVDGALPSGTEILAVAGVYGSLGITYWQSNYIAEPPGGGYSEGAHSVTLTTYDAAGNPSSINGYTNFTIDTVPPDAPGQPDLAAGSDSGTSATDNITNVTTPSFTGISEAYATIEVFDGTTSLGETISDGSGAWTLVSSVLTDGSHTITATQVDQAGNASVASAALTITIDTVPPAASSIPDLDPASDTGVNFDNTTGLQTLVFNGTAEPNVLVTVSSTYSYTGVFGTVVSDSAGNWSVTAQAPFQGAFRVSSHATDTAGNSSTESGWIEVWVDLTPPPGIPGTPDLDVGSDTGNSASDDLTYDTTPQFNGTVSPLIGVILTSSVDGVLGSSGSGNGGSWSITPSVPMSEGVHLITVQMVDDVGNQSTASAALTITIDTTASAAPGIPDLATASDSGTSGTDDVTNISLPTFSGTADPGFGLTLTSSLNGVLGATTADQSGDWIMTVTTAPLVHGTHVITATQTEPAGNTSVPSGPLSVIVDLNAPGLPLAPDLDASSDTGDSDSDDITSVSTPTLSGTAEPNVTVEVTSDIDGLIGSPIANGAGVWTLTTPLLTDGSHTVSVRGIDVAGNRGLSGLYLVLNMTIDTIPPLAPSSAPNLDPNSDSGVSDSDDITSVNTPIFAGSAEPNRQVEVFADGVSLGTTTANASGLWSLTSGVLTTGNHTVTATQADVAGNWSLASLLVGITIDQNVDPVIATLQQLNARTAPVFSGTTEPYAAIEMQFNGGVPVTTTANGNGLWSATATTEGAGIFSFTATDVAGNVSVPSQSDSVVFDVSVPEVLSLSLLAASDSGSDSGDQITNRTTPSVSGVLAFGAASWETVGGLAVSLSSNIDGILANIVLLPSDGVDFEQALSAMSNGVHTITATVTDPVGNVSTPFSSLVMTVDTGAPDAPGQPDLLAVSDSGSSDNDDITSVTSPSFSGTAEPNHVVEVFDDGATSLGITTANSLGDWTLTAPTLSATDHMITAVQTDIAGNTSLASTALALRIQVQAATPLVPDLDPASDNGVSDADNLTNDTTPTLSGSSIPGAAVTVFSSVNGISTPVGSTIAGPNGVWHATSATLADGTHVLTTVATDIAGNTSAASAGLTIIVESISPDVVLTSTANSPHLGVINVTATFSEDVTGFDLNSVSAGNGTASNFAATSASVYTFDLTPSTDGAVTVDVPATLAIDAAGNGNNAALQFSLIADNTAPGMVVSTLATSPQSGAFAVTATFNEDVSGFGPTDLSIGNGTVSNFAASSASVYVFDVTPSLDGSVTIMAQTDVAQDTAGNGNSASNILTVTSDKTQPGVVLSTSATSPHAGAFAITATFSEGVTGFAAGIVVSSNGTISNFSSVSASVYTFDVTPNADGAVNITVPASIVLDSAGNGNIAATQLSLVADNTSPGVVLSSNSVSPVSDRFNVTAVFDEDIAGLEATDFVISNGSLESFTVDSARVYSVWVLPTNDGAVTVNLPQDAAQDVAGNGSAASAQFSITADLSHPTVTLTTSATSPHSGRFSVTATFSDDVTGFAASDVSASTSAGTVGVIANFTAVSASVYTFEVLGNTDGFTQVTVHPDAAVDAAGNALLVFPTLTLHTDNTSPSVTFETTVSSPHSGAFPVTATFSEDVVGFLVADLIVGNGTASNFVAVSARDYSFDVTPTADGSVTVQLGANAAQDVAGNPNLLSNDFFQHVDTTRPTVALSSLAVAPHSGLFRVTATFSEVVSGAALADFVITNGTASNFSTQPTYVSIDIIPTADGVVTVDLLADAAVDAAGNGNTGAPQFSIAIVGTAPTVVLSTSALSPHAGNFAVTATFNKPVTGFDVTTLWISYGAPSNFVAVSSQIYTFDVVPSRDGPITVEVHSGFAQDDFGSYNSAAVPLVVLSDSTSPNVELTSSAPPLHPGVFVVTATFDEDVTGFEASDLVISNGTATGFTAQSARLYTFDVTANADGDVTVRVPADVAQDLVGHKNLAATPLSVLVDLLSPRSMVFTEAGSPLSGPFIAFVAFEEDVTGFDASDIIVTNGTIGDFLPIAPSHYSFVVTPIADGVVTLDVPANVAQDPAGNGNLVSPQLIVVNDTTGPVIELTTDPASIVEGRFNVVATFSETVTEFTIDDILVTNGTVGNFIAQSAQVYSFDVTSDADGLVTVEIEAGTLQDEVGNLSTAAVQLSVFMDTTAPAVPSAPILDAASDSGISASDAITNDATPVFAGTAEIGSIVLLYSNLDGVLGQTTVTDGSWTFSPIGMIAGKHDLYARAFDDLGNGSDRSDTLVFVLILTSPTASVTTDASDPHSGAFTVTASFSDDVIGFEASDLVFSNATVSDFASVSGSVYTLTLTPMVDGPVTVNLAAAAAQDLAGNATTAATQLSITIDSVSPTVSMTTPASLTIGAFAVSVTFSEAVSGFDETDITLANGTVADFVASSATQYSFVVYPTQVRPPSSTFVVETVDIAADVAFDAASNGNLAALGLSVMADSWAPACVLSTTAVSPHSGPFTVSMTCDEGVWGFDLADIAITNGSADALVEVTSGSEFTFFVTPAADGLVTVEQDINGEGFYDAAGNGADYLTPLEVISLQDVIAPTLVLSTTATSPHFGAFLVTATFSEDVTGFVIGDVSVGNGAASDFAPTSASVYTFTVTPTADGLVSVDLAEGVAQDLAGHLTPAAVQLTLTTDSTAPSVVLSTAALPAGITTHVSPFTVTATFTEDVTGFDLSDINVGDGTASNFVAVSATVYTFSVTASHRDLVTVDLAAGVAQDAAGNLSTIALRLNLTVDSSAPSVVLSTPALTSGYTAHGFPFTVTATFSEDVIGFDLSDISVSNGTASDVVVVSAAVYAFTITPTADGTLTVDLAASAVQDASGNPSTSAASFSVTADVTRPTVSFNPSGNFSHKYDIVHVDFFFSEPVTLHPRFIGFVVADNVAFVGLDFAGPTAVRMLFLVLREGSWGFFLQEGFARDSAGLSIPDTIMGRPIFDNTAPTLVLSTTASNGDLSPTPVTATFSEDVTGFDLSDIQISTVNGTLSDFVAVSARVYTFNGNQLGIGLLDITVPADAAQDMAGNGNATDRLQLWGGGIATTIPPITYFQPSLGGFPKFSGGNVLPFSTVGLCSFSCFGGGRRSPANPPNTQTALTATVGPAPLGSTIADAEGNWSITLTSALPEGEITLFIIVTDLAGHVSPPSPPIVVFVDTIAPDVVLSTSASTPHSGVFVVTATFTEDVTGFDLADAVIGNGTAGNFATTSASVYTFDVTPTVDGPVTVDIAAGAAQDSLANLSTVAAQLNLTADSTAPGLTLSTTATAPHSGPFSVTASFTEDVTGFELSDVVVGNGTASDLVATSAQVYTVTVTPTADGPVTVDVPAAAAQDHAGNDTPAATQLSINSDSGAPSVALSTAVTSPHTGPFMVTATFTEDVTGFDATDLVVNGGTTSTFTATSPQVYTVTVTPTADGLVTVDIAAGAAQDGAGNLSAAARPLGITTDATAPSVVLSGPEGTVTGPFTVTATFDEVVTGLLQSEIRISHGTVTGFSGSGAVYHVTIDPVMGQRVEVSIPADMAQDAVGKGNLASTVFSVQAGSPASEFEANRDAIRDVVVAQAERTLQATMGANQRMVSSARTRFIRAQRHSTEGGPALRTDIPFDIDGTAQIANGVISSQGTFFEQSGDGINSTRRLFFGDFTIQRDVDGSVNAQLAGRIAWERMLSDRTMMGTFMGAEIGHASLEGTFIGQHQGLGLSAGAYVVTALRPNLYANAYFSLGLGQNDLQMSNGTLGLSSDYGSRTVSLGFALTGVIERAGYEIWPSLAFDYGYSHLGQIGFSGTAYGLTDDTLTLNAGSVSIASLSFAPEFRIPLDGVSVADSTMLFTATPRLVCDYVQTTTSRLSCGGGGEFGITASSENGLRQFNASIRVDRINSSTRSGFELNFEQRF